VTVFLDTSVLVAAVRANDQRHAASFDLVKRCSPENAACAAHTLAELYAGLTGMRPPNRFRVAEALQLLEQFRKKFQWVELNADEILETAHRIGALGLLGGIIYDALLLACARKVNAERIYTWNERHFKLVAPDLAERIVTP
jgi:predicted nucleic acid-binding protein